MKANRKFTQADDAVSPVIAVILMVAITVVLAATVFVLVSDIGGNKSSAAPSFNLQPDEGLSQLKVESAAQNADWSRLEIKVLSCTGGTAGVNIGGATANTHVNQAAPTATGGKTSLVGGAACATQPATLEKAMGVGTKMNAGDYLEFCGAGAPTNVKLQFKDVSANLIAFTYTFTSVKACTL